MPPSAGWLSPAWPVRGYSVAIAVSMSRRAARRGRADAGQHAGRRGGQDVDDELADRDGYRRLLRPGQCDRERRAEAEAEDGAEQLAGTISLDAAGIPLLYRGAAPFG